MIAATSRSALLEKVMPSSLPPVDADPVTDAGSVDYFRSAGAGLFEHLSLAVEPDEVAAAQPDLAVDDDCVHVGPVGGEDQRPDRAVRTGQSVAKGEIVAFIAAGLVLVPVIAEKAGTVSEIVAEAGTLVGYGSTLLKTET